MRLETDLDVGAPSVDGSAAFVAPEARTPANVRDNVGGNVLKPGEALREAAASSVAVDATTPCRVSVPHGWWTSDGLGLIRRTPAGTGTPANEIQTHYYPLNTLTRISGRVRAAAATAAAASAWLTLYSAQPCGTTTQLLAEGGARVEVMLHRHLSNDDGRGLGTGVDDRTILAPAMRLGLLAVFEGASCGAASSGGDGAAAAAAGAASPPVAALHEDWLWGWATRAAVLQAPFHVLYADLSDLQQELPVLAAVAGGAAAAAAAAPPAPPREPGSDVTRLASSVMRSEPAIPRRQWTDRYSTSYRAATGPSWSLQAAPRQDAFPADLAACCAAGGAGPSCSAGHPSLCAAVGTPAADATAVAPPPDRFSLPPWLHLLSLQVRDGVTDDVTLRLQNYGGPAVSVDIDHLLGGGSAPGAHADGKGGSRLGAGQAAAQLALASLRPRSLTLNQHALPSGLIERRPGRDTMGVRAAGAGAGTGVWPALSKDMRAAHPLGEEIYRSWAPPSAVPLTTGWPSSSTCCSGRRCLHGSQVLGHCGRLRPQWASGRRALPRGQGRCRRRARWGRARRRPRGVSEHAGGGRLPLRRRARHRCQGRAEAAPAAAAEEATRHARRGSRRCCRCRRSGSCRTSRSSARACRARPDRKGGPSSCAAAACRSAAGLWCCWRCWGARGRRCRGGCARYRRPCCCRCRACAPRPESSQGRWGPGCRHCGSGGPRSRGPCAVRAAAWARASCCTAAAVNRTAGCSCSSRWQAGGCGTRARRVCTGRRPGPGAEGSQESGCRGSGSAACRCTETY